MEKYIGKSVYKGTAIGPVNVLKKRRFNSLPGCMIKH